MSSSIALAIFVKTPGLSPIKTRLAAALGAKIASEFYELALNATGALAQKITELDGVNVYWAIAEADGLTDPRWQNFPTIYQDSGGLGERLSHVYDKLLAQHQYVCFIGADSPHLSLSTLRQAISRTKDSKDFVLGPTDDGGFYFFGGGKPLPRFAWLDVEYSSKETARRLTDNLSKISNVVFAEGSFDIDTRDDLSRYLAPNLSPELLPEQITLFEWVKRLK